MTTKVKYNKELLEQICERDKCIVDYNKIDNYNRDIKIEFICSCGKCDTKNFRCMYKNGVYCDDCMKIKSNERKIKTYLERYGVINPFQDESVKTKIKQFYIDNYGVSHNSQTNDFKDKFKQTCLDRYGVENYSETQECRDKMKQTCLERYGVEYALQSQEVKNKILHTNLERYGVENPNQNKEVRNKTKKTCLEKYGVNHVLQSQEIKNKVSHTNLERYGAKNYTQTQEFKNRFKQTCLDKYGVEHISQSAEIAEKQIKGLYKLKSFTFPCGNIIQVQGYEPFLLDILVKEGYTFDDIIIKRTEVPEIWYNIDDKKHRYYCDIYIPKINTIYEVKSIWTNNKNIHNNKLKKQACIDAGFNFELYVFNNKGIRQHLD